MIGFFDKKMAEKDRAQRADWATAPVGMIRLLHLIFLLLASQLATSAIAQSASPDAQYVTASLAAEHKTVAPGGTVMLAIEMRPQSGWHGYWKNAGDAGFGLKIDWQLPEGVTVSDLQYPVPKRYLLQGLMNYVYEEPYAVLAELKVAPTVKPDQLLDIVAKGQWLACSDRLCVRQSGRMSTSLLVEAPSQTQAANPRFTEYRSKIPPPLREKAAFGFDGDRFILAVPLPSEMEIGDQGYFFPDTKRLLEYASKQEVSRKGDTLFLVAAADRTDGDSIEEIGGILKLAEGRGLEIDARYDPQLKLRDTGLGSTSGPDSSLSGFAVTLAFAFLGGLLLNILPCVFPILGLKAIALAKSGQDGSAARQDALAYSAGVILSVLLIGAVLLLLRAGGEQIGWAFQLQYPPVVVLLAVLMVAITANLASLYSLPGAGVSGLGKTGAWPSFLTGVLAAFVATPCTGPFMALALGAALLMPTVQALLLFAGLGLGLAAPFILIAYIPALRSLLPKPGPWMERFRRLMAIPMFLTAAALCWLAYRMGGWPMLAAIAGISAVLLALLWFVGRQQRRSRPSGGALLSALLLVAVSPAIALAVPSKPAASSEAYGDEFSQAALDKLLREKKPVFLYFTADWCATCKANEAIALNRESVRSHFEKQNITVLRGDFTLPSEEISEFLSRNERSGVPYYVYYDGEGRRRELPELLTPGMLQALGDSPGRD